MQLYFIYIFIIKYNKKYYFNIKLLIISCLFLSFIFVKKIFNEYLDAYKCENEYFHSGVYSVAPIRKRNFFLTRKWSITFLQWNINIYY